MIQTLVLAIMIHPITLGRWQQMLMLLPLCLTISVVYKTTKCERIRDIPLAAFVTWVTIVVGIYLVGAALFLLYEWSA